MAPGLVRTGTAATELGVNPSTLYRWWHEGKVVPARVTAGRHARWNLEDLQRQVDELREREEAAHHAREVLAETDKDQEQP